MMLSFSSPVFGEVLLLDALLERDFQVLRSMIEDWIELKDTVHLDTAACNEELSPSLRRLMKEAHLSCTLKIEEGRLSFQEFSKRLIKFSKIKRIYFPPDCEIFPDEGLASVLTCADSAEKVFPELAHLEIDNCIFSKNALQILANCCPNIKTLYLEGHLSDEEEDHLSAKNIPLLQFKKLEKINIERYNGAWTTLYNSFLQGSSPKILTLMYNEGMEGIELYSIQPQNLEQLEIAVCPKMHDSCIQDLFDRSPKLKKLCLVNIPMFIGEFSSPLPFKDMKELTLDACFGMTDQTVGDLFKRCEKLTLLSLRDNPNLTGECLSLLRAKNIEGLYLSGCSNLGDKNINTILKRCEGNLRVLDLSDNHHLTGECFTSVHTKKLEVLKLSSCRKLSDKNLNTLLKGCENLKFLNLGWGNSQLTGDCLLGISLKHLEEIRMSCVPKALYGSLGILTNENFVHVVKSCPKLTSLGQNNKFSDADLSFVRALLNGPGFPSVRAENTQELHIPGRSYLSDEVVGGILKPYLRLKKLNLSDNSQLTGACFSGVQAENIAELTLSHCPKLRNENLNALLKRCKNLTVLHLSGNDELTGACFFEVNLKSIKRIDLLRCPGLRDETLINPHKGLSKGHNPSL